MPNPFPDIADDDLELLSQEERIQLAIATINKAEISGRRISERAAAIYFRVPRATLQDRRRGVLTRVQGHAHERALSSAQEDVLAEWVKVVGRCGFPLSLETIGGYASKICGRPVGENWPQRFKERHPDLKVKWTSSLEECRARALNPAVVSKYFALLKETIDQFDIKSKNIYNMDEKGIQLGVGDRIKALVDRDQKTVQRIHTGTRDLVTIIECICADGTVLHPSVVFEGARRDLNWGADNPANARLVSFRFSRIAVISFVWYSISISPNGWTDQELGALWLEKDFAPVTAERLDDPADYRLVILDGHNSHGTFRFMDFAEKHRIVVLCLPSHTTHALQPCDVGVFGPLARKWKARVSELARDHIIIDKYNLLSNYSVACDQAFSKENILAAFRKCGIWPLDESAIGTELFAPALNYTTQAAQPLPARLLSLLVPIGTTVSNSTTPTSSSGATADITSTTTSRATLPPSAATSSSLLPVSPSGTVARPFPAQSCPSTPPRSNAGAHTEVIEALYKIAVPSPLRGRASAKAMAAENAQLRTIAKAAGVEFERNHVQMVLMDQENARLRKQLHAKKHKRKRTYNTGHAQLMTGPEMQAELLKELQRKHMAEMHLGLKKLFPAIKKTLTEAEKAEKAAAKRAERESKAAAKEVEKAIKAAEKEAAKVARAAEKEAAKAARAAVRARGRGGSRGGRGRGARSCRAVRGGARGRVQAGEEAWDSGDEEDSAHDSQSDNESDHAGPDGNGGPDATNGPSSDEETDSDAPVDMQDSDESDSDNEGAEETGIHSINGHRWRDRHVEFQVLWTKAPTFCFSCKETRTINGNGYKTV
ncbi:DDE-domain-containing protein [Mycena venus]|uniref:DDE-domain-containing protein n=1 Tax=Mycena venus TaxID=2733690 RepID=A0A8H6X667_9AGAR|nr:DDE-domain-containing protein [Mycena venus]